MPTRTFSDRLRAFFDPRPARWRTVVVFAVILAYADGYVLVAVTGAVGAIQRTDHPFPSWMEQSAILIPFFVLAELLVLRLIRRRTGPVLRSGKAVLVSALLLAIGGAVVGVAAMTASAAYDYRLQTNLIDFQESIENENGIPLIPAGTQVARGNCNSVICNEERFSLAADIRGVGVATPVVVGINIVLVGWVLACFGGRLGAPVRRRTETAAATVSTTETVTEPAVPAPAPSGETV